MADDLNKKLLARLENIEQRLQRQERTNPLEAASVTSGRVRFAGGLLRIDSGGRVEIVGTLEIDGTTTVTGSFTVTGPWNLEGNGTITGAVTITGNVTSTGTLTQNGPWIFNGVGTIAGNVTQTGDLNVTGGGSITAGLITIDPSVAGGSIGFGGGRHIDAASGYLGIYDGSRFVVFNSSGVSINGGGGPTFSTGPAGLSVSSMPTRASSLANSAPIGTIWSDTSGNWYRVVAG